MNPYQDSNVDGQYVFSQEQSTKHIQEIYGNDMVFPRNASIDQNHIENNMIRTEQLLKEAINKNQQTTSFSEFSNNAAAIQSEEDRQREYSELISRYTRQPNQSMQEHPQQDQAYRFVSPHVSPQHFSNNQNLSPSMKTAHSFKMKETQQKQLNFEQNTLLQENNNFNADIPRQRSNEKSGYPLDGQDPLFMGNSLSKQGVAENESRFQNEVKSMFSQNPVAQLSSVQEVKETYFQANASPYLKRAAEDPSKTSLRLLHDGVEDNKGDVKPTDQEIQSLIQFYSSEYTLHSPSQNKTNLDQITNKISREPSRHTQNNPLISNTACQLTADNNGKSSGIKSGGNLLNFQRFATRNIKNQFHDHNNFSGQNSPYAIGSPSGKKTKMNNFGIPREPNSMQNLGGKIDSKIEQINEKRGRTAEEKYSKVQHNGINKGHSTSELEIIQERRKIQMEEASQLQQTASSQNEQPNITAQSDSIIPSYRQPKALSNSFWSLQRLHVFVKENKNYSITEQNKIDHGKMILTYQESFSDQTFFKSLTLMYFQQLFFKDPQLGISSQLTLFDLLNFVNNDQITLHSVPLKDIQGEQLKEVFIKNIDELANLRITLSSEALFEKFLQLFTQDPLFCEALLQVLKQSVALTCDSSFKVQASSFLQIASQNWFDIKTEFFPLLSNAFNSVIEMHYLLDNQIEISTFKSLRAQPAQLSTLSFVYYYNQTLKKQFYLPLFSLEDSVIFGTLSSFFRHSPSQNFLSQLTQNSALSKSESLKRFNDPNNQNDAKDSQQKGNIIPPPIPSNFQTKLNEVTEINPQLANESTAFQYSIHPDTINQNVQKQQGNSTLQYQDQNLTNQQQQLTILAQQYSQPMLALPENIQNQGQKGTNEYQLPSLILPQKVTEISPSHFSQKDNFSATQQGKEEPKDLVTIASPPLNLYSNIEQLPQKQFDFRFLSSKIQLLMQMCNENTDKIEKAIQSKEETSLLQPGSSDTRSQQDRKKLQQLNLANLLQSKNMYYPQTNVANNDIEHRNRGNSAPRVQHFTPSANQRAPPNRTGSPPPSFKRKDQHQLLGPSSNSNKNIPSVATTPAKWQSQYQKFEDAVVSPQHQRDFIGQKKQNSFQGQTSINRYGQMQTNQTTSTQYKHNQPQQIQQQSTQNQIGYNLSFGNINSTNRYPLQKHPSVLQYQYPKTNNFNAMTNLQQQNTQISTINSQLFSNKPQQVVNPSSMLSEPKQMVPLLGFHQQQQYLGTQSQQNLYFRRNY